MKRTYIDAGVLIVAARGVSNISDAALEILDDPEYKNLEKSRKCDSFHRTKHNCLSSIPMMSWNIHIDESNMCHQQFLSAE